MKQKGAAARFNLLSTSSTHIARKTLNNIVINNTVGRRTFVYSSQQYNKMLINNAKKFCAGTQTRDAFFFFFA